MPSLQYGSRLQLHLDETTAQQAMQEIAAHASRGGWVFLTDLGGRRWSLLISAGIPVWVSPDE
jgi:hypothetical protein